MSKLNELIQQYCPDGVEYVEIGSICTIKRGKGFSKSDISNEGCPIILYGELYTTYKEYINTISSHTTSYLDNAIVANSGDILLPISSTTKEAKIGKASVLCNNNVIIGGDAIVLHHQQCPGYLMYLINSCWFELFKMKCVSGTTIMHLSPSKLSSIEIPVPPLPVQEEIVRILDTFTELQAELQAELQKRKQQYNYYRDNLLSFDGRTDVEWISIEQLFNRKNGYTPSKSNQAYWTNGTIPWFRMEDIRQNGRVLSDSIQKVHSSAVKRNSLTKAGSIILATSATIGEHALVKVDCLTNQRFTCLTVKESCTHKVDIMFLFYYMFKVDEWCKAHTVQGNFPGVDMSQFPYVQIPLPPLAEQKKIVEILDRFDTLTNDLTAGLPAEIEKRKQQYEYYRDKLLTFKRKEA